MKLNKIIIPVLAAPLLLTGCYDEKMDWHTPDGHYPVVSDEIPLSLQEKIANYDNIKAYMAQYMPNVKLGLGLGADKYISDDTAYVNRCNDNFQQFVTGNAMKHGSVVQNDGSPKFTTIDAFLAKVPSDIDIYGHNFIWHTQQNQTYLKSLIAPTVEVTPGSDIANVIQNGDFESGTKDHWSSWGNSSTTEVQEGAGYDGSYGLVMVNPSDADDYSAQLAYDLTDPLVAGKKYIIRFKAKASTPAGTLQFATQNSSDYSGEGYHSFSVGTEWTTCEYDYTCTKDNLNRVLINFGKVAGTYYIDDVEFGEEIGGSASAKRGPAKASSVTYKFKTPEEKKAALLGAMESWIKGMAEHLGNRISGWDVINEPITDGTPKWRGIEGNFSEGDSEPVEDPESGFNLNWESGHFYWGYYIGKEYATKAFELARKYAPNAKLYVNDYNLETSPAKLAELINFVKYIDENGSVKVDGIGTQMHVDGKSITKEQIDAMFQTLAATGKLIRISELDVRIGTTSPTADDLQTQSDVYQMIIESYKANIPEAQQGGITLWTLSDAADEHTYWYPDDAPNIFDKNYARKTAYKGVCDGIAGKDISEDFTGDMWMNGK